MLMAKFTQGLRGKSIGLIVFSMLVFTLFFMFYVHPEQERNVISTFKSLMQRQLQIVADISVSPIRNQQFAEVYELLDQQLATHPSWQRVKLTNASGQIIYPLRDWDNVLLNHEISLTQSLLHIDKHYGQIILVANYSAELDNIKQLQYKIISAILLLLFSLLAIVLIYIEKEITRPLNGLTQAFRELANQNFDYLLPEKSKDEVATIISEFSGMREDISHYLAELITLNDEADEFNKKLQLSALVFSKAHDGIIILDRDGIIIDVNPAFCQISAYSQHDVLDQHVSLLNSNRYSSEFYQNMWSELDSVGFWKGELWNYKKTGELYAESRTLFSIQSDEGELLYFVGMISDITINKQQQEKLEFMAHYDELTQLPNRVLFADRFTLAIAHTKRNDLLLAVCFLDLDKFKPVNDNYGHEVGDQLLIEVATRIKRNIREEDTVSRQGGDEFAILLNNLHSISASNQLISRILDALSQPYILGDIVVNDISASCGITIYPLDDADEDILLRHADQSMYMAKQAGRNRYHIFNSEQEKEVLSKHYQLAEIETALENNEFQLYYQPKVNMRTGKVCGVEALIRWQHPERGLLLPLEFLPLLERTELEVSLGTWVIHQALVQLAQWNKQGLEIEVSVNVSSYHLLSASFCYDLKQTLDDFPMVNSNHLQLELLETSVFAEIAVIADVLRTCRYSLGLNIALDDFGTGYSSLSHIRNFSANTIKIDQSFVKYMLDIPDDYAIIEGVLGLANSFNRNVIAEGVETMEHGLMLLLIGCDTVQGHQIARPMPADKIFKWVDNYIPDPKWLECGEQVRTVKQAKICLFELALKRWQHYFELNILSMPGKYESMPIMAKQRNLCGKWILREKQESVFSAIWLEQLEKFHDQFHDIASQLLLFYQNDQIDKARAGLTRLASSQQVIHDFFDSSDFSS